MLNNITNFFNLIRTGMVKSQLESSDLLPIGTRDSAYGGSYKPTMVKYSDLAAQILAGVPPLTIGITPIASGTAGKLLYEGAGNVLNESPVFNIDPLTGFLGVNTTTPQFAIDMQFSTLGFYSDPTYNAYFGLNNGGLYLSSHTRFVFNTSLANSALTIEQSGNILINTGTDAGFRLDVNGTARVQGNAQFGTGFYWDNTNSRLGIGTSSPSTTLHVVGQATISSALSISGGFGMTEAGNVHTFTAPATNRTIRFITNSQSFSLFSTGNFAIGTTTDAGFKLDVNGTARVSSRFTIGSDIIPSAAGSSVALAAHVAAGSILDLSYYTGSQNALSTTKSVIFHGITFSPSSGTAIFNQLNIAPILNQTGTANGAVRGFYYNPTVTSVLGSHWAIHTTAGRVRFEGLPTSSAGLSSGDIWNDGGTLKIV